MSNSESKGIIQAMLGMPRFGPAWFSIFVFGMSLLFIQQFTENMRVYMIPSLLVYSLGTGLLGSLHRMLALNYVSKGQDTEKNHVNDEQCIPTEWKIAVLIIHIVWFAAFIAYNFCRNAL